VRKPASTENKHASEVKRDWGGEEGGIRKHRQKKETKKEHQYDGGKKVKHKGNNRRHVKRN